MNNLIIFILGGITFRYGIDVFDNIISWIGLITNDLQNKQTLKTTQIQAQIDEITQQSQIEDDSNRIGFQVESKEFEEEDY